jgi:hypothetical protein
LSSVLEDGGAVIIALLFCFEATNQAKSNVSNKLPQTRWIRTAGIYSFEVQEIRSPESKCCSPKALGK